MSVCVLQDISEARRNLDALPALGPQTTKHEVIEPPNLDHASPGRTLLMPIFFPGVRPRVPRPLNGAGRLDPPISLGGLTPSTSVRREALV